MRNTTPENLTEHSAQVAVVAHALALAGNRYFGRSYNADRAATMALFHDACEVFTGDMPTPVKYFSPQMRSSYEEIESAARDKLLGKLPSELRADYAALLDESDEDLTALVKAADKICALVKCIEEEKSGNTEFASARRTLWTAVREIELPEVKWFVENALSGFALDVDEL